MLLLKPLIKHDVMTEILNHYVMAETPHLTLRQSETSG